MYSDFPEKQTQNAFVSSQFLFSDPQHSVTNLLDPTAGIKSPSDKNETEKILNKVEESDDEGGRVPGDTGGEDSEKLNSINFPSLQKKRQFAPQVKGDHIKAKVHNNGYKNGFSSSLRTQRQSQVGQEGEVRKVRAVEYMEYQQS